MPFKCEHCERTLAGRSGDKLLTGALEIEFKRTHYIKCPHCRRYTKFGIDKKPVNVVKGL